MRPTAPVAPQPAPSPQATDDDDAVIVPAPDASVFFHKPEYATKPKQAPVGSSLKFRRTIIPIALTGGFIMAALGAIHFLWSGENNPMGGLPIWLVSIMFAFALLLWTVAGANMMTVKQMLEADDAM